MDSRRSIDNFFKYGKLRKRYYLYVFIAGLLSASFFGGLLLSSLRDIQTAVVQTGVSSGSVMSIYDRLFETAMFFFFSFLLFTIMATAIVMYLEGRIGGASVALIDVIEQFKLGNYSHSRELRAGDELQAVMDQLKELGSKLKDK